MHHLSLRNLAIVLVNVAVIASSLEVILRVAPNLIPLPCLQYFEPDLRAEIGSRRNITNMLDVVFVERDDGGPPHKVYRYIPMSISRHMDEARMDAMGFCNPQPESYEAEHFDVIAIGDSFTFCFGVSPQSAWPHQLSLETGLSVYNLGMPNTGVYEYVQFLKPLRDLEISQNRHHERLRG